MGILFIGINKIADGLNPIIIGSLIIAIGLFPGGTTGYAINPARDLGPRIAHALLQVKAHLIGRMQLFRFLTYRWWNARCRIISVVL